MFWPGEKVKYSENKASSNTFKEDWKAAEYYIFDGSLESCQQLIEDAYFAKHYGKRYLLDAVKKLGRGSWVVYNFSKKTCKVYTTREKCEGLKKTAWYTSTSVRYCNFDEIKQS